MVEERPTGRDDGFRDGVGLGLLVSWLGLRAGLDAATSERLARACFGSSIAIGGAWLYPRALRSLGRFRLDIDVLMGLAMLGAVGAGPVGRGGDGRLPVRAVRGAGGA